MIYVLSNNNSLTQKDGMLKIIFNIEQMKLFSFILTQKIYILFQIVYKQCLQALSPSLSPNNDEKYVFISYISFFLCFFVQLCFLT